MTVSVFAGPTPSTTILPILNRDLEDVVYTQVGYPKGKEEREEFYGRTVLRRMPTKNCGILEIHGIQGIMFEGRALERAIEAARAAGYSDAAENTEEAVSEKSDWGPSGYLIASLDHPDERMEARMREVGFTLLTPFFNTIWVTDGDEEANRCTLWGMHLSEQARTGEGHWREEPFYQERAARLKKVA